MESKKNMPLLHKLWVASRAEFLTASIFVSILAGSLAIFEGSFSLGNFLLALFAVILAHIGTNMANDYFDYLRGNYPKKKSGPTGGSFAIQQGLFGSNEMLTGSIACVIASIFIFYVLSLKVGAFLFLAGMVGTLIGFFYNAPPLSFGWRKYGEAAAFIGMGPVLFAAIYFAASGGGLSPAGIALSVFSGSLVANIIVASQLPDIEIDRKSRKPTLASLHGAEGVGHGIAFFFAAALLGGAWCVALSLPLLAIGALLPSFWLTYLAWQSVRHENRLAALMYALKAHAAGTILPALALLALSFFKGSL